MNSPQDDIAFLANSENRITVLGALIDGPRSRHVIQEETEITRVTLSRILDELESYSWIRRHGQLCDVTPLGEWVYAEFTRLISVIESEQKLRRVSQWFPETGYEFHISHLADAEITVVKRADASAPISTLAKQFEVAGTHRAFSFAITSQFLTACWRHVMDGSVEWEWVFTTPVLEVLQSNPEMARQSREMLESGGAEYRHYDGEIPHVVIFSDELVNIRLADEEGAATALLQVDEQVVRSWAESTFDRYWRDGTPIPPAAFTA